MGYTGYDNDDDFFFLFFGDEAVAKGQPVGPIINKLNSLRTGGKKGKVAVLEYRFLETATNHFDEARKIAQGSSGCVYKAFLGENFLTALKKFDGEDNHTRFQVIMHLFLGKMQKISWVSHFFI